jgi:PKD repeat protein
MGSFRAFFSRMARNRDLKKQGLGRAPLKVEELEARLLLNGSPSTTTLASALPTGVVGSLDLLTASVTGGAGQAPTGVVAFYDGTKLLGLGALNSVNGKVMAELTTALGSPIGSHALTAEYEGDSNYATSTSAAAQVSVTNAGTKTSTTTLTASASLAAPGQPVTLTAKVTPTSSTAPAPTGSVEFITVEGGWITALGNAPLANGTATLTTTSLPVGNNNITAVYTGDSNFTGGNHVAGFTTVAVKVGTRASTTALTVSPSAESVYGQTVTFTATETDAGGGTAQTPTGIITFTDATTKAVLGSAMLTAGAAGSASATFTTSVLAAGGHKIVASYGGDGNFAPQSSAQLAYQVSPSLKPTASFGGPASVSAGSTTTVVSFTNVQGGIGADTYSFDFADNGTFEQTGSSASATVPESYLDAPGVHVVHGRVTDSLGDYTDYTVSITVNDVPPTPKITAPAAADAGVAAAFTASATDPSTADTSAGFTYAWSFGDGGTGSGASASHTFAKAGTYTITLTATDKYGFVGTTTLSETVAAAPTAAFSGPASVNAGSTATVSFANASGGSGGYTYSFDFADNGTFEQTGSSASATVPESYLDAPGVHVVHGRVTDSLGAYTDYTVSITVKDVAPTPKITPPAAADAGVAAAFTASATDPSTADTNAGFTYAWNFGDGGTASGATASHSFAKAGTYTITLTATDKYGGVGTTTASVTVAALPSATFTDPPVNAGSTTATVEFSNQGGGSGGYTYSYDFGNTGTFEITGSSSPTATIPEQYVDAPGTLVVHGRITDSLGGYTDYTVSITVNDVPPTPKITPPAAADAGVAAAFTASATDPSTADTSAGFTYAWNFGDGSTGTGASASHTYAAAGTYTVTLTATDAAGGVGATTASVTVGGQASSTLQQGGFETPALGSGNFAYAPAGSAWAFTAGAGIAANNSPFTSANPAAPQGSQVAFLQNTGSISQAVSMAAGSYTLTLQAAQRNYMGTDSQAVGVLIDGASVGTVTPGSTAYASYSTPAFTVAVGTHTIELLGLDPSGGDNTAFIDAVILAPAGTGSGSAGAPTATFSGPTTVSAGATTAHVTFSSPTGGSGVYTYSYDFNDSGTFEITNSTSATAPIPEQYVDAPGTLVVHGRITDSLGGYTDYTTSITVKDVPPTPTITPPSSATAGAAAAFTASATDPSTAETKAGFSYAWNFGDGSTGTGASASHTYAAAGTYTVTLTATDAAGGVGATTASVTVGGQASSTLQQGGFETPALGSGNFAYAPAGSAWAFTAGAGIATNNSPFFSQTPNAPEGSQVAFLQGTGSISQAVNLPAGSYAVTFDAAQRGSDSALDTVEVLVDGASVCTVTPPWGPYTYDVTPAFTVSAGVHTITIKALNPNGGDNTAFVDAVALPPAPTPSISGPAALLTTQVGAFTASATDPSTADTAAGFTYAWNFGDGSTAAGADVSHAYPNPGTYTVVLTATTQEGVVGTTTESVTVTAAYIPGLDAAPNFGANPTIVSVQSGNWSAPSTWSLGRVPGAGDVVDIMPGTTVTYDTVSTANVTTVDVEQGGTLQFRTDINTQLTVTNLLVSVGGTLTVGTASQPVAANVTASIVFPDLPINTTLDPTEMGDGLIGLGNVFMCGAADNQTWVELAADAHAGDTTLTLSTPVIGWVVGDKVILPDTQQLAWNEVDSNYAGYMPQYETATIAGVSANGLTLTLAAPLQFDHLGSVNLDGQTEFEPDVALMSHNVVVHSANPAGVRGHVIFLGRADVDIRYVQFGGLGRTQTGTVDDTTFDSLGNVTHVGTNEDDRFAVFFDEVSGPTTIPADGYQFTFVGNDISCPLSPMPYKWGLALNQSSYGLIEDNVIYNWAGAGLVTMSGAEVYNLIQDNFVCRIVGTGNRDNDGMDGDGYWFQAGDNYIVGNVATDITGPGPYEYGFGISPYEIGPSRDGMFQIPAYQGADGVSPGQYIMLNVNAIPLLEFSGNEVYGATMNGLNVWWLGVSDETVEGSAGTIKNFTVWNVYQYGIYLYNCANLTIDGYTARGDTNNTPDHWAAYGIFTSDYPQWNLTVSNASIEGCQVGIQSPPHASGTVTISNCYLEDQIDVSVETPWTVAGGLDTMPYTEDITNDIFVPVLGDPLQAIVMWYSSADSHNVVQNQSIFVYNFNGVAGANFQVYYTQQAPDYVVPMTGAQNPGDDPLIGAPVAGLTNQQLYAQYGLAIGGAIAPDTDTEAGIINAYVRPL